MLLMLISAICLESKPKEENYLPRPSVRSPVYGGVCAEQVLQSDAAKILQRSVALFAYYSCSYTLAWSVNPLQNGLRVYKSAY